MAIPKVTIIDGNNEIELSTIEDNVKTFMVKGEPGTDAVSPSITTERDGKVTTITIVDKDGTKEADINDGFDPVVNLSKENNVVTLSVTDFEGQQEVIIKDGVDLTGGVPTNGVIGYDTDEIIYTCDGTETGNYYLTYDNVDYYFTMPTVEDGDILTFNTTDLTLKLDNTTITTSSTGTGTELTFNIYIPNGYETTGGLQEELVSGTNIKTINNESVLGSGNINISGTSVENSYSSSTTAPYSCNYLNDSVIEQITTGVVGTDSYKIIKYSNGLMVAIGTQNFGSLPFNADWWGFANRVDNPPILNLPITFISILFYKIATNGNGYNNQNIMIVDGNTRIEDNNKITCYLIQPKDGVGSRTVILDYFVIGTWK